MNNLPKNELFDGFYIWFNSNEKKEYYSTPLYFYHIKSIQGTNYRRAYIELKKDISKAEPSKVEISKEPTSLYAPYIERFGMFLIKLLNADFSNFETAYNTFFYAYGFELLKKYSPGAELKSKYSSEVELINNLKEIYEDSLEELLKVQNDFRHCVDFLYNLNGNTELQENNVSSKFIAYIVKHKKDIHAYSNNIEVTLENYESKFYDYPSETLENLIEKINYNESMIRMSDIYTSSYLSNICFIVLEQIVKNNTLPIKTCKYCERYFIPAVRQDEIYCDLPNNNGRSCREKGAKQTYKDNFKKIPALLEYRKIYQRKFMVVSRSGGNEKLQREFDNWKKVAQDKIKEFKQGNLSEDALYRWMRENK